MAKHRRRATRTPLESTPLRTPGQSLSERYTEAVMDRLLMPVMIGVFAVMYAVLQWWWWFHDTPPEPMIASVLALITCLGVCLWIRKQMPYLQQLKQGEAGEKAVGQCLEKLRSEGYEVFHDIIGDGHNIDHVLVGPGGVFVIETKTLSKPVRGGCEVVCDGESVLVNGKTPDRNPLVQVKAAAREMARIIRETTGHEPFIRSVIVYPGWYTRQPRNPEVWVLNEKALPKFLGFEQPKLDREQIKGIAYGITMHVRNAT